MRNSSDCGLDWRDFILYRSPNFKLRLQRQRQLHALITPFGAQARNSKSGRLNRVEPLIIDQQSLTFHNL